MQTFVEKIKEKMGNYKVNVLKVEENGVHCKKTYSHILPEKNEKLNFIIPENEIKIQNGFLNFLCKPDLLKTTSIKLHQCFRHLTSSQVLTISYFYDLCKSKEKINTLLSFLGLGKENVSNCEFEYENKEEKIGKHKEGSQVDFCINLESGKKVFFEIKYTEQNMGPTNSKQTDKFYLERKEQIYSDVECNFENFKKYYQLVRLLHISKYGYSIIVVPSENTNLRKNIESGLNSVTNLNSFQENFKVLTWEELLKINPNNLISEKYF